MRLEQLYAFVNYCWYDWSEQITSMERLVDLDFEWILPGHGRRHHTDKDAMKKAMRECVDWMKEQ